MFHFRDRNFIIAAMEGNSKANISGEMHNIIHFHSGMNYIVNFTAKVSELCFYCLYGSDTERAYGIRLI